ncbi:MAG: hypothetical protein BWX88_01519 [Planctomycetes bacterium ADurb.Bin126]|nr:MAG: hypothetical protein BWX88_01519 [Planctomycetes bacterium ADurb.Bin126]
MHMLPRVQSVKALPEYRLELTFTSGEIGIYDCRPLLHFGVFAELQDEEYFRQVELVNGTVAWPHDQDICPDTLYAESQLVKPETAPSKG